MLYFQTYLNFSSGIAYYVNVHKGNECDVHYVDFWNDWCFGGPSQSQTYVESITIGDTRCDVWGIDDFHFINAQNGCQPVTTQRDDGTLIIYWNLEPLNNTSGFFPPSNCHTAPVRGKIPEEYRRMLHHHPALLRL